jgi:nitrogen fixation protein FixH
MRKLLLLVARNRWPLYLSGLLAMAIAAYAVLIYVATRPSAPRPIPRYYETAERWDVDEAAAEASRQLGWSVHYEIPKGVPHVAGTPRPVDVRVVDREGKGVTGLAGRLLVVRPSDQRRSQSAPLVGLPQEPGRYRALVVLDEPGAWELRIDAKQEGLRFVHAARVEVAPDAAAGEIR